MTLIFGRQPAEMPDDVRSLDAELRSIQYEERPSFGPELAAELAREWERLAVEEPRRLRARHLAAAAIVLLLLATAGVPSARASWVRLIGSFQPEPEAVEVPTPREVPATVEAPDFEPGNPLLQPPREELARTVVPLDPPLEPANTGPASWPESTLPEIADRQRSEALIRRHYPAELQRLGVGGSVRLRLWVKEDGSVDNVQMAQGTGIPGLDRAAMLDIGPSLRFMPATRRGVPVGTWVEFDVVFQLVPPDEADADAPLPTVDPVPAPVVEPLDLALVPEWRGEPELVAPAQAEAGDLLEAAIGSRDVIERIGPIESILAGDPPAGVAPTQWRAEVGVALEQAMARAPDNPAPMLALARIRRKQGLRTEARVLFDRGLQRAIRAGSAVSPNLVAELHFERATLLRDAWQSEWNVGRVPTHALQSGCAHAAPTVETGEFASVDRLIAWNYLCPSELDAVLASDFEPRTDDELRAEMLESFRAAMSANGAHVGANVEVLLALAEERRWTEVLDGANEFVRVSGGHPYGLLLGGLALQRMARSDEAAQQLELALRGLPDAESQTLTDLTLILDGELLAEYRATGGEQRLDWVRRFWYPLDPVMTTAVNEREVEHLVRAAFAFLRYGRATGDPAEVWLRYGSPTSVRVLGEDGGVRTEFWDYGNGPDVTFARVGPLSSMMLTSEGRAYVDDLLDVFPHRYGAASRRVFTLPGQVSRFRGVETGAMDFEMHTRVPRVLATGDADSLDLGVFYVGSEGDRAELTRRRVQAAEVPISVRIPVHSQTGSIVLELFNARTGQAAALRQPVEPMRDVEGARISDVMVVSADTPPEQREIHRGAEWMQPLVLARPIDADAVGAYFELYTEGIEVPRYYLRAEVVDVLTGATRSVPVRPAGERGFQDVWDRRTDAGGVTREFLTVALTDVERGQHTLRVIVDVPEVGSRLMAEQSIDRREE